jgi:hypothetical protein
MIAAIGWIGSVLCVWSLVQENQARFRALNLGACVALIAFNIGNAAWSGVLLNIVVAAINVRQLIAMRSAADAPVRVPAADRRVEHIEHPFASV